MTSIPHATADPEIAGEVVRSVAKCDYLIITLRGDRMPAFTLRQWIRAQFDRAEGPGVGLIVLTGSQRRWAPNREGHP